MNILVVCILWLYVCAVDSIDFDVDLTFLRPPVLPLVQVLPLEKVPPTQAWVSPPMPVTQAVSAPPADKPMPTIDRSKKPSVAVANDKPSTNKPVDEQRNDRVTSSVDQGSVSNGGFNHSSDLDLDSSSDRMRKLEEEVEQMRQMKTREARDIADLMRRKRKMEEEMRVLETEYARRVAARDAAAATAAAKNRYSLLFLGHSCFMPQVYCWFD